MCGLVGFFSKSCSGDSSDLLSLLTAMTGQIIHRGPDDAGHWHDDEGQIGLGHRRLSILDLSPAGHQPMHSPSQRYVIAFNGEIYNHFDLRRELEANGEFAWRGHSVPSRLARDAGGLRAPRVDDHDPAAAVEALRHQDEVARRVERNLAERLSLEDGLRRAIAWYRTAGGQKQ